LQPKSTARSGAINLEKILPGIFKTGKIFMIRGEKVMLDRDLAVLYGVETRALNQAVSRNIERFPSDFMFTLSRDEIMGISHIVISSKIKFSKNVRAFTENGVAMLSSVLRSKCAIQVNIQIMRAFTQLRSLLASHADLRHKIEDMEKRYDEQFRIVFEAITQLIEEDEKPPKKIGYIKEKQKSYGKRTAKQRTKK
jgi:hypothetical protein